MNCRPGDLAIVVRSRIASNLGKIVHVVGRFENGDSHIISLDTEDVIWLCRTEGSDLRWSGALGIETIRDDEGPIPDSCLRALRPGTESDDVARQVGELLVA
jgi:hypothetical protein